MTELDVKANDIFVGKVVRKDMVSIIKGNAVVPTYVLEFLLGMYCATNDEASRIEGIERVKEILRDHYVHRHENQMVRSIIREKGQHKVIDKVSVKLNEKNDCYEATFANLGIDKVVIDSTTIKKNRKLLVSGIWSIVDLKYEHSENVNQCPWVLERFRPIQLSSFDVEEYKYARSRFTTEEWLDLLIQSLGFNPENMSRRSKLLYLTRLIPYCERNYNIIELGPKGTGKSHVYSDFSPHGILISGGVVTVPKLFVNNSNGKLGLVGYWDCIAFDEFAGKTKKVKNDLVDIMKNYMANKTFSRAVETLEAEASFTFVGNTQHNVPFMLKHTHLFDDLPQAYQDTAFLDRIHFYLPGWEIPILRNDMFTKGYGLIVDYLAEALRHFRNYDFMSQVDTKFVLNDTLTKRDKEGIKKTVSGLLKILYPSKEYTTEELRELVLFAMEGRKRVKDQLNRMDETFRKEKAVFGCEEKEDPGEGEGEIETQTSETDDSAKPATNEASQPDESAETKSTSGEILVKTLEEKRYPAFYYRVAGTDSSNTFNPESFEEDLLINNVAQSEKPTEYKPAVSYKTPEQDKAATVEETPEGTDQKATATKPTNSTETAKLNTPAHTESKTQPTGTPVSQTEASNSPSEPDPKPSVFRKGTMGNFRIPNINPDKLPERIIHFEENQTGFSFAKVFGNYLVGAKRIVIEDPFIHHFHQLRNLVEFIETIISYKREDEEIEVVLKTTMDNFDPTKQKDNLERIQSSLQNVGIQFTFNFKANHDRHIFIDQKWHVMLGRGLDIFQKCNSSDQLDVNCYLQTQRPLRDFTISIRKVGE